MPLRAGYTHLQHAAGALPGFELVGFDHACCGSLGSPAHPARPGLPARPASRIP
jgi:hypothetical protein